MSPTPRQSATEAAAKIKPLLLREITLDEREAGKSIEKAGVVPFKRHEDGSLSYFLMLPVPKQADGTKVQFAKGTVDARSPQSDPTDEQAWKPLTENTPKDYVREPLLLTAIREGAEEVGLVPANIKQAYEWGKIDFVSGTTGAAKTMWLYFVELKNAQDFDAPAPTTEARGWIHESELRTATLNDKSLRNDTIQMLELTKPMLKERLALTGKEGMRRIE
jgi:8-oxo-dGTP pyrophosphatase MutT (NUDIX family)